MSLIKLKIAAIICITVITSTIILATAVLAATDAVEEAVDISSAALSFSAIVSIIRKEDKP